MCGRLGISRASYYRWLAAEESPTATRHKELTEHVKVMFDSSDGIFGHRMVHTKLAAERLGREADASLQAHDDSL